MASLTCPRANCSRFLTNRAHPFPVSTPAKTRFSTAAPQPLRKAQLDICFSRPSIIARTPPSRRSGLTAVTVRRASSSPTASPKIGASSEDVLTWNRFFDLRKKRRYLNLGSSIITAAAAVGVFGPVIAQQDVDGWAAQVSGLDPIIVLGLTTFAVAGAGWLCGPSFGSAGFRIWAGRKGWNRLIAEKEKSFYARIKRYRADPSSSSPQNPIPDYYGEKIASVKDYRRWLKDQRAFNLKKSKSII